MSRSWRRAEPGFGGSGRNNGQVIPTLSRPDPGRHRRQTRRRRRALRRAAARLRLHVVRSSRADTRSRRSRSRPAGSSRCIRRAASRSPSAACGNGRKAARRRVPVARGSARHARLRCLARRLLEQDRRPHQSAGAVARPCARGARSRRAHLCALAGLALRAHNDRWIVTTEHGEISGRALILATNAYTGEFSKALAPDIAREVMPVRSWQMATAPLSMRRAKPSSPAGRRCRIPMASFTSRATMRAIASSPAAR